MLPTVAEPLTSPQVRRLYAEVDELCEYVTLRGCERYRPWAQEISRKSFAPGARNLAGYLAFRERDLRALQDRLIPLGLSSLGRCEAHVLPSIQAVRATLAALCGAAAPADDHRRSRGFALGDELLRHNTRAIFGSAGLSRPHIMVTLPSEAATHYPLVRRLVEAGMDSARINCAHDDADAWSSMADNVRRAARETTRVCRVYMDIAGPKIRVGKVLSEHPRRRFSVGDSVRLTCTEKMVYDHVRPGAPVWIDDGKIGAVVVDTTADAIHLKITNAPPEGSKIRPDKGLNFPQSAFPLPALGEKDLLDLDAIARCADIVGQSFVRDAADVRTLLAEFALRSMRLPIIAKIETAAAVSNLPDIIVAGASKVPFGVMIARGDLAIEVGYPRLAEIQEELLWVCEAAHVPVIWATQVLDNFVRKGIPTRAEITDAATAEQAECVMLNKGPFIVEAVSILSNVLTRMQGHQFKKTPRLRALHAWNQPGNATNMSGAREQLAGETEPEHSPNLGGRQV